MSSFQLAIFLAALACNVALWFGIRLGRREGYTKAAGVLERYLTHVRWSPSVHVTRWCRSAPRSLGTSSWELEKL